MYETLADRILTAPASSNINRHNCWPGGYIDHVNRVVKCSITLYNTWRECGYNNVNFTEEELVFTAINHDLGKVGTDELEYYIPNDADWQTKRGQVYKLNPELQFMKVPDRSLYMLQKHNIPVTENEYLAIKLHDGLYSKGNESYLMAVQSEFALKTDMPIMLHHADHMATLIESQTTVKQTSATPEGTKVKSKLKNINDPVADASLKETLKELYNNWVS
jgi:hypothetical protein